MRDANALGAGANNLNTPANGFAFRDNKDALVLDGRRGNRDERASLLMRRRGIRGALEG